MALKIVCTSSYLGKRTVIAMTFIITTTYAYFISMSDTELVVMTMVVMWKHSAVSARRSKARLQST